MKTTTSGYDVPPAKGSYTREPYYYPQTHSAWLTAFFIVRTVFMVLGPSAVSGIAVGATAVILTQADPTLHHSLITLVWGTAVVTSAVIVTGILLLGRQATREEGNVDS